MWFWVAVIVGGAVWVDQWWSYLIAFVLMGPMYARFAILMHESAHKLLFTNKRWNDVIGKWVVAYPVFTPVQLYRRVHFAHHKDEFGPDEPDIAFYRPYPCTRRALYRRLFRDAVGISGWKNFVPLVKNTTRKGPFRPIGLSIFAVQIVLWAAMWAATGRWWIYPLLWFAALDDRVARHQPPALHRGARGHGAQPGPPGDDAQRAPVVAGAVLDRALQHRLAPGPPRRHGRAVAQPARLPRRARAGGLRHRRHHVQELLGLWKALSSADETTEVKTVAA